MGLLDDAIKQHLELKRKHGAAEEEVKRQEAEALGPARRDFAAAEPAAEAVAIPEAEVASPPPEAPTTWLDEEEPVVEAPPAPKPIPEPEPAPEPAPPPLEPEPAPPPPEPVLREDPAPLRPDPPEPVEPRRHSDTPTQGFPAISRDELEDEPAMEPAAEVAEDEDDEDVLEETPEFLQDTPEHDRLWFEQKPPRDFDFEG